jgi:glycosyltransferase involved in cell wall biosynthesis
MEAFSAGVPVLAFPTGGIPEIVEDGRTGFLAAESTPAALARGIVQVFNLSPETLSAVISRARLSWEEKFKLNLFQQRICSILTEDFESGLARKRGTKGRRSILTQGPALDTASETSAVMRQS